MIPSKVQEKMRDFAPKWRPGRYKATLVALPILAVAIPLLLLSMPYLEWFNDMAVQPKGKAQSMYGLWTGERDIVERPPVEGTMPMEGWPAYRIHDEDPEKAAVRAGEELRNPVERTRAALELGRKRFETFCIVCHGPEAEGNGKVVGKDLFPAPPSLHTDAARGFPDGRIFHVITKGQNKMPSYADVLDPQERWSVVHYVRVLQRAMEDAKKSAEDGR